MIKLEEEDRKRLVELYEKAQTTPVITTGFGQPSWAHQAWDKVRDFMNELGKKYNFNPQAIKGIDPESGEVKL